MSSDKEVRLYYTVVGVAVLAAIVMQAIGLAI